MLTARLIRKAAEALPFTHISFQCVEKRPKVVYHKGEEGDCQDLARAVYTYACAVPERCTSLRARDIPCQTTMPGPSQS